MLTFFEYLRQRSYESIVAGVQDALDSLEKENYGANLSQPLRQGGQAAPLDLLRQTARPQQSGSRELANSDAGADAPTRPRRRGRPRKPTGDS